MHQLVFYTETPARKAAAWHLVSTQTGTQRWIVLFSYSELKSRNRIQRELDGCRIGVRRRGLV